MWAYITGASLISDLLFEYINMTCFLLLDITLNYKFNWDLTLPCMIIPRIDLVMYDFNTLQCIIILFSHISITIVCLYHSSFIYNWLNFLRISIWHASSFPIKPSIWAHNKNRFSHVLSSSTLYNHFDLFAHISITIVRPKQSSFIDNWLTFWVFQYDMLPPPQ